MDVRTLVVDAPFLFKRSFFGAKDLYTPEFGHVGGLYGFLITVRKLIKEHSINKVVLMWDGENSGRERHLLDRNYKANRESKSWHNKIELTDAEIVREENKDISILNQMVRIQHYAEELYFRQIIVKDIEADDLISQYCMDRHNIEDIFIFTNDRDIAQVLDLNVTILFANIDTPITRHNFSMYFNYHYSNVLTIKILTGDSSDNIKGIKGLGEKGLLSKFPELSYKHMTVNEICNRGLEINRERIKNKKKPLKVFESLLDANTIRMLMTNFKLINLKEPMLNDEAIEELAGLENPLDDTNRGTTNIYPMMKQDGFLSVYGYDFLSFIEPFFPVATKEIDALKRYKIKNNLK